MSEGVCDLKNSVVRWEVGKIIFEIVIFLVV